MLGNGCVWGRGEGHQNDTLAYLWFDLIEYTWQKNKYVYFIQWPEKEVMGLLSPLPISLLSSLLEMPKFQIVLFRINTANDRYNVQ